MSGADVVLVTGAAAGVGAEVVRVLRAAGTRVVAVDRDASIATVFAGDNGIVPLQGDVSLPATAQQAAALALDRFGRLDGLVNNAARFLFKPLLDTSVDEWDALFAVNVRGMMLCCQAVLPHLVARQGGAIVNVASISGLCGMANQVAYGATKGAIVMLTKALAIEQAPHRIRVNAVAPGAIDTGFVQKATGLQGADYAALAQQIAAAHPLGRMAQPTEVAEAIRYLLSPQAAFITGTVVPIDGGWTAQ
jgi:NAD(P)-dependent dehydrogenase (short-subunit alcohol dehydrogenase family)